MSHTRSQVLVLRVRQELMYLFNHWSRRHILNDWSWRCVNGRSSVCLHCDISSSNDTFATAVIYDRCNGNAHGRALVVPVTSEMSFTSPLSGTESAATIARDAIHVAGDGHAKADAHVVST